MVGPEGLHHHDPQDGSETGRSMALRHARARRARLPEQDHLHRGRETGAAGVQARRNRGEARPRPRAREFPRDGDFRGGGRQDASRHALGIPVRKGARLCGQELRSCRGDAPDPGTPRRVPDEGGVVVSTDRRMFLKTAAASAALALPAVAVAQSPQAAARPTSGKGGLSKARVARMREAMLRHVESGRMPGLVTLVSRRGETPVDAIGVKAFGGKDPMRRDTIFRIASITKPITAAAAMILVEEAKLRLDDPVDPLLPELANRKVLKRIESPLDDTVSAKRAITLRDLLTFRLGIGAVMVFPEKHPIQESMSEAGLSPAATLRPSASGSQTQGAAMPI